MHPVWLLETWGCRVGPVDLISPGLGAGPGRQRPGHGASRLRQRPRDLRCGRGRPRDALQLHGCALPRRALGRPDIGHDAPGAAGCHQRGDQVATMAKTHSCLALKWLQGSRGAPGGSDALKLRSWSSFSQGNGSRTSSHMTWSFLHVTPAPQLHQCWLITLRKAPPEY